LGIKMTEYERIGEQIRAEEESIKLFKNTKGYNWEIKILKIDIPRLVELNKKMQEEFGSDLIA